MSRKPLTLAEFRLTRRTLTVAALADALGDTGEVFHEKATCGLLYEASLWINRLSTGDFFVLIERDTYRGELPAIEAQLYFGFYATDCCNDDWTLDALQGLLEDFAGFYSLPPCSPGDWTSQERHVTQFADWFTEEWELAIDREEMSRAAAVQGIRG